MEVVKWTRRDIFDAVHDEWHKDLENLVGIMKLKLLGEEKTSCNVAQHSRLVLKKVICTMKKKWKNANRIRDRFLKDNKIWLDSSISITVNNNYIQINAARRV